MGPTSEVDIPPLVLPGAPLRLAELQYIITCIRQNECCSVVGISNSGKSWLLRCLRIDEIRTMLARPGQEPPAVVFVDCLESAKDEQGFYGLLLRRTVEELARQQPSPAAGEGVWSLHDQLVQATSDVLVRSLFSRAMRALSDKGVLLILDEFDDAFRTLPPWPFRHLRVLRDALEDRFMIVTATSAALDRLRPDADTYEFRELFQPYTMALGPVSDEDAQQFVSYLARRYAGPQDEYLVTQVIGLVGGHLGLLKRVFEVLRAEGIAPRESASFSPASLLRYPAIEYECQRLWDELDAEDQRGLLALVAGGRESLDPVQRWDLEAKGLVRAKDRGDLVIFSPVFGAFVKLQVEHAQDKQTKGVHCDLRTGRVWVDERELTSELTDLQRRLVMLLYEKDGGVLTYEEIADKVYDAEDGVAPGAIYELVGRLREEVESNPKKPQYIITVRGIGYQLKIP